MVVLKLVLILYSILKAICFTIEFKYRRDGMSGIFDSQPLQLNLGIISHPDISFITHAEILN